MHTQFLATSFDGFIAVANSMADAIPEDADVYSEAAMLSAAYASASAVADLIMSLPGESALKERVATWLDGRIH